jgi:hypothetical protein
MELPVAWCFTAAGCGPDDLGKCLFTELVEPSSRHVLIPANSDSCSDPFRTRVGAKRRRGDPQLKLSGFELSVPPFLRS